jgi:hypothetical protein
MWLPSWLPQATKTGAHKQASRVARRLASLIGLQPVRKERLAEPSERPFVRGPIDDA